MTVDGHNAGGSPQFPAMLTYGSKLRCTPPNMTTETVFKIMAKFRYLKWSIEGARGWWVGGVSVSEPLPAVARARKPLQRPKSRKLEMEIKLIFL